MQIGTKQKIETERQTIHNFSLAIEKLKGKMSDGKVTLLMVDDDDEFCALWNARLRIRGLVFKSESTIQKAKEFIRLKGAKNIGKVLVDFYLRQESGLDFMRWCREFCPGMSVLMISGSQELVESWNHEQPSMPFVWKDNEEKIYQFLGIS